jgi:hypothetical protein
MNRALSSAARLAASLLAAAFLMAPSPAARAAGAKRVGVPKFDGGAEALVRKQVMQVLKAHGYELAKSREMDGALQNTGALLESDDGFQKVAKELSLTAIVTGEVGKKKAKIIVHDGREGSVLGEASFPGANPKKIAAEVGKSFWSKLGEDVARGHVPSGAKKPPKVVAEAPEDDENAPEAAPAEEAAPPPPEPKAKKSKAAEGETAEASEAPAGGGDEGEAPPPKKKKKKKKVSMDDSTVVEESASEPASAAGGVPPIFDAALAPTGINRSFSYHQDQSGLRPYSLPLGGAVALQLVAYPISFFSDGPAQHIGFEGNFEQAFGIQSSLGKNPNDPVFPNGATFATTVHEFAGGVRYRIPFGAMAHQVWFSFTGGEHAFVFKTISPAMGDRTSLDIPDTIYRFVRPGVGARFELPNDLALGVSGGFRYILNAAGTQFGDFFPHRTVYGVDAEVYVAYRFMSSLEARVGGELRQYGFSMHSTQADAALGKPIAGGAVDRYISGTIGIAFLYGGSERPAPAEEPEAPPPPKKKHKKHHDDDEEGGGGGGDDAGGGGGGGDAE